MIDSRSVAIADARRDLLQLLFRLRMSSWPRELRPELRRMLAEQRQCLLQA